MPRMLWITADPAHIAQIASWTEESEDGLHAHFSPAAVREIRDHAQETRPGPRRASGREVFMRVSFDNAQARTAFALGILELGGKIVPQIVLPSAASAELVP